MPRPVRFAVWCGWASLALLLAAPFSRPALGQNQGPAAFGPQASDDTVVATVNDQEITKSQVLNFFSQYQVSEGRQEAAYRAAIDSLINSRLLRSFLEQQNVRVSPKQIDEEVDALAQQLQESGQGTLNTTLGNMGISEAELRRQINFRLRLNQYVRSRADEQTLRNYFGENKELFTGTQIQARHILIKVSPDASEQEKQAARQKLLDLKPRIQEGELSFAKAADRHSEDDGNVETPDGGNLGYFGRGGPYLESFTKAAFDLEVGAISDPVKTEYGYHLIQVTDRRQGRELQFENIRDQVLAAYGQELQDKIVEQTREQAEIDIKPMPDDFFTNVPTRRLGQGPTGPATSAPIGTPPTP